MSTLSLRLPDSLHERLRVLAAEEGSALTHAHLERAIRMEFREIGKLAETGTLE